MIDVENEFLLSEEIIETVMDLLDERYAGQGIFLVHSGIIASPRLMKLEIIPGPKNIDLLDPEFKISSLHVATAMRIFGLNQFGTLYFHLLRKWGIKDWKDISMIINAFKYLDIKSESKDMSLWISSLVELRDHVDLDIFSVDSFSKESIIEEIDFADNVIHESFISMGRRPVQLGVQDFMAAMSDMLGAEGKQINFIDDEDVEE